MTEFKKRRTLAQVADSPVVETRYESAVIQRRGLSSKAFAGLVVAAIIATVAITMLILDSQQRNSDELARERARIADARQTPVQQQPVIIAMPASQPAIVPVPYPVPASAEPPSIDWRTAPSNASVEIELTSRLQDDQHLKAYAVFVKVTGRTAILSGNVPGEDLRKRAEKIARTVKGVHNVINTIVVRPAQTE